MAENRYDDAVVFTNYSQLARSVGGLAEAGEWSAFRSLLPDLRGKRVLDLGCGFGWHCRHACEQGARSVVGVDLSEKMLERARALGSDARLTYVRSAIEDVELAPATFDVVISSLALHYVADLAKVLANVRACLRPGGALVFSVEHPIFTARAEQDWCLGPDGERRHWPVDGYQDEGPRTTRWMGAAVVKHHRTVATWVDSVLDAGFRLERLVEPEPPPELLEAHPDWKDERRRPMMLLVSSRADPGLAPPTASGGTGRSTAGVTRGRAP
ncbi:Methyltransferase type 11 [Anaeromyxobacter dehalogenans 2CP-1]|uniref:Methyltransferase type 11 n=1 Tax=Anaeromyxobacter dehalogenans (strain ATCC BAA-258 / DSM 21875 / 2CP-1) TaxID=455488 RepID=B8JGJ4_ANAD2|nr:class I SAM-dependent methyltransferase [Anaeromyxobacter dehalogenans]ACL64665.1 Methyltransferase type 11 [Anaeromyxobacter dehalogenans 2CP-1]